MKRFFLVLFLMGCTVPAQKSTEIQVPVITPAPPVETPIESPQPAPRVKKIIPPAAHDKPLPPCPITEESEGKKMLEKIDCLLEAK